MCVLGDINRSVPQDSIVDLMVSENSQLGAYRKGINFLCANHVERSGVCSDIGLAGGGRFVLGLRTRNADAETVRVLQGRARESV